LLKIKALNLVHGREKDGVQPQTLCTDPLRINIEGPRTHSFEIGFKPGTRVRQEYDEVTKKKSLQLERDNHTKFGHVITIHELGAMAIRDRTSDDTIGAYQTISALRSFIQGVSNGDGQITFVHSNEDDVTHALNTWRVSEYSFTARPLNPTGGDLEKMRTEMYHAEHIYQESGKVTAVPGESLVVANGTLGQTYDLYEGGYAQIGFKGETEDGHRASIPKSNFSQDRSRNLKVRESSPRYLSPHFSPRPS